MKKIIMEIDTKIYPLEAVLSTCYAFLDRVYFFLDSGKRNKKALLVYAKPKPGDSRNGWPQRFRDEFLSELLYAALRHSISRQNSKVREYIIGSALYAQAGLLNDNPFLAQGDYKDDPLGIAIPQKRNGKKDKKKV